jgi:hypothetical protein
MDEPRTIRVLVPVILPLAHLIDHQLEVLDVPDTNPGQSVRVTSNGEDGLNLGDVGGDAFDVLDAGLACASEAQRTPRGLAEFCVIDHCRVAPDDADFLQSAYATFDRRRRETDSSASTAEPTAALQREKGRTKLDGGRGRESRSVAGKRPVFGPAVVEVDKVLGSLPVIADVCA